MDEEKNKNTKANTGDAVMIAKAMADELKDIIRCQDNIYKFNGKCYDLMSDRQLDEIFMDFCLKAGATKAWNKINSIIRAFLVYPEVKKIDKMNDYSNLICLSNGVLNIYTKEFTDHPTEYYFDSMVNVDYDKTAKNCPVFLKYLSDTFNGDKETMGNIIRLGGYLLDTSCQAEKMFLFDGNGANGKSVLINIFSMFFSEDQISPLSLDVLASNGFSKELLIKSRVNFAAEQKKSYLDSEEVKKIITGDRIEINRKFKISLSFIPKTKIIVACNGLPKFNDTTHAIYRRMILVRFPNQYLSQDEYNRSNSKRVNVFIKDNSLFEKIKLEKSAILNLFIEGLIGLRKENYEFVESKDSVMAMMEFKRDSDTVREFLEDNYEADENARIPLCQIYSHYKFWYARNVSTGIMKFRSNEMGRRIIEILKIQPLGREYVYNSETQRSEKETIYPIKEKIEPVEEHIATPEEKAQIEAELGLKF